MKKSLLLLFLTLSFNLFAQEDLTYEFKYGIQLNECNALGAATGNSEIINKGTDFIIEQVLTNGDYIIHIIKFKSYDKTSGLNAKLVYNTDETKKLFLLSKASLNESAELKYIVPEHSFTFGAVTVPIKLRFGSKDDKGNRERYFDFTGDVNIGLSAGWKWRPFRNNNLAVNVLAGFSITSVEVDEQTTNNFVTTNTKASAFTPNLSVVFEAKNFQIGLFTGIDYLSGELSDNWIYQNKPWLGIGLGYGIFSKDKKESTETEQKTD